MSTKFPGMLVATLLVLFSNDSLALGQLALEVIAQSNDSSPDGDGDLDLFFPPVSNDQGQVSFRSLLQNTDGSARDNVGLFRRDSASVTTTIVRLDDPAPDSNGNFSIIATRVGGNGVEPALNNIGQTAFRGNFRNVTGVNAFSGIFRGDGAGVVQIVRGDDPAPDGNGIFSAFSFGPDLNDSGEVAFNGTLTGTTGVFTGNGIFRGDGSGPLTRIVRGGDPAPDANGIFTGARQPSLNNSGQVAFQAFLAGTSGGGSDNNGIFRGDGLGSLVQIARAGQAPPDGNGSFFDFNNPALNNSGQAVFTADLSGTTGVGAGRGIFRGDGASSLVQVARGGDAAPDGNGAILDFFTSNPELNSSGQTSFHALLTSTSNGFDDDTGIFRGDGSAGLAQIAREGETTPTGNGVFSSFGDPIVNDLGQTVFTAGLRGTSAGTTDDQGLFAFDDSLGLVEVVREGDSLLGGTIISLSFLSVGTNVVEGRGGINRSGLNNRGDIAFQFRLTDGRQGIAVASLVPEPTSLLLVGLGGLILTLGTVRTSRISTGLP